MRQSPSTCRYSSSCDTQSNGTLTTGRVDSSNRSPTLSQSLGILELIHQKVHRSSPFMWAQAGPIPLSSQSHGFNPNRHSSKLSSIFSVISSRIFRTFGKPGAQNKSLFDSGRVRPLRGIPRLVLIALGFPRIFDDDALVRFTTLGPAFSGPVET